jgi:hypothetical protein
MGRGRRERGCLKMKQVENLGGMEVNVNEAIQYLSGETRIDDEGKNGYYILNVADEKEEIQVTVDYVQTESRVGKENYTLLALRPIGIQCIFNETYQTDSFGKNPFSFEQLSADLHAQELEKVDEWAINELKLSL